MLEFRKQHYATNECPDVAYYEIVSEQGHLGELELDTDGKWKYYSHKHHTRPLSSSDMWNILNKLEWLNLGLDQLEGG